MTEKPSDIVDPAASAAAAGDAKPAKTSAAPAREGASAPPPPATPERGAGKPSGKGPWVALIVVALLAAALAAALWYQRQEFDRQGKDLAGRIDGMSATMDAARRDAGQAMTLAQSQAGTIKALQTTLAEIRTQYQALQDAWDHLSDGPDDAVMLNDIEQLLAQGNQQLRLGGNVSNAIVALEIAQGRLSRSDRPELAPLQQAIDTDLSRLRAVPLVDVPALAARVDRLIDLSSRAPLLVPDAAAPGVVEPSAAAPAPAAPRPALPEDMPWWQRTRAEIESWPQRALDGLGREMSGIISIQRVEDPNSLLLAPDQATQLRAALRMRLLTAQVALLMRQPAVWKSELATVSAALAANYDARSVDTAAAVQIARELSEVDVTVALPELGESQRAIAALRAAGGLRPTREE